ncbi:hypothetical protein [Halovulum sp. GXIMD14793]
MTKDTPEGAAGSAEKLAKAREVYAWVFKALQTSLKTLEDGTETLGDSKTRDALFRQHVKQLQMVSEIEGSLDEHSNKTGAGSIDLDAARTEIRERLAR